MRAIPAWSLPCGPPQSACQPAAPCAALRRNLLAGQGPKDPTTTEEHPWHNDTEPQRGNNKQGCVNGKGNGGSRPKTTEWERGGSWAEPGRAGSAGLATAAPRSAEARVGAGGWCYSAFRANGQPFPLSSQHSCVALVGGGRSVWEAHFGVTPTWRRGTKRRARPSTAPRDKNLAKAKTAMCRADWAWPGVRRRPFRRKMYALAPASRLSQAASTYKGGRGGTG